MRITPTLVAYYHLCHRKLWLHANEIRMEQNSRVVAEGKLVGETAYQRRAKKWKELQLEKAKIDHYDPVANTVREIKKSSKLEHAHIAQLKYYLYALEQRGVVGADGIIEYPKQRKTTAVKLTETDRTEIRGWEAEIEQIVRLPVCPELVKKSYCRTCAFRDFCFV